MKTETTLQTRQITARLISLCRIDGDLNYEQISKLTGIHKTNISKYQTKSATPSAENLIELLNLACKCASKERVQQAILCA